MTHAYNGDETILSTLPPHYFINVRDDAKLHVLALAGPVCDGERLLAFTAPYTLNKVLSLLRKLYPDRKFRRTMTWARTSARCTMQRRRSY